MTTAPFIFIGTHKVREGKLDDFKRYFRDFSQSVVEANEPRLISFNGYADDERSEVAIVQVHPDADSMLFHMGLVRDHIGDVYEQFLDETTRIEVYGPSNDDVEAMIRELSGGGVPVTVKPGHFGGFTRAATERSEVAF